MTATATGVARLKTVGVTKRYGGTTVLDTCSIEVQPGEVLALVGHNGAGKSTLSKIISGYERASDGGMELDGENYDMRSPKEALAQGVALVPQQLAIIPAMSVTQNLVLGLRGRKPKNVVDVARRLGIERLLGTPLELLGPAAQRLVMIGRSLIRNPRVLILDEPTAAFSLAETDALFSIVRDLTADGISIIYVSHRLPEILRIADRVVGLSQGRLIADTPTAGLTIADIADIIAGGTDADVGDVEEDLSYVVPEVNIEAGREVLRLEAVGTAGKIKDASLTVRAGEVVGLTGLVGAGRSSLLSMLWGTGEVVTKGTIQICGKPFEPSVPRRAIASGLVLVPEDRQRTSLIPRMTVRENVTLPTLRSRRFRFSPVLNVRRERAAVSTLLRELDAKPDHASEMPIESLSGGNQQKAVLSRWLMVPSEVVVLDEPCEGVDVRARLEIHAVLRGLADGGKGVLVSSSDVEELVESTDRILIMRDGQIVDELGGTRKTVDAVNRACF